MPHHVQRLSLLYLLKHGSHRKFLEYFYQDEQGTALQARESQRGTDLNIMTNISILIDKFHGEK